MKQKLTLLAAALILGWTGVKAQTSCTDLNGFVNYKNIGGTGYYTLNAGYEERAAQTYHYSGPGNVQSVRVYGNYNGLEGGVPLRINLYNVDAAGRPTSLIQSANTTWWWFNNPLGYVDVSFGSGSPYVNQNFAVGVEVRNASPWGNSFQLQYTGNGEGRGQDLASLSGTSTGWNWTSAMTNFNRDGDFYIVPKVKSFITPNFSMSTSCLTTGGQVSFTNLSLMSLDSMFNKIGLWNYTGGNHYYEWNFGDASPLSNAVNPSHTYTNPGVYTVSLKNTFVGWNSTVTATKTMQVSVGLAVGTSSITPVSCSGLSNGSATAIGTGGATPYSYSLNGILYQTNPTFNNLAAGVYTLTIKDNLGCTNTTSFTITQPSAISFTSSATTNATCGSNTGAILVSASGGTGTLQYQLNAGPFQSNGSFQNIGASTNIVTVKDGNGCTTSEMVTVNDQGGPSLTLVSYTNISCNGGSDGSLVLLGSGGSGTLQYSINGGNTFQTSGTFNNLPAGLYGLMVKDAAGCKQTMKISLMEPSPISFTTAATAVTCNGGSDGKVTVTSVIGGTGIPSFSLDGVHFQSGTIFSDLTAGTYTVSVKDAAGCMTTGTIAVTQPTAVSATLSATASTCNGSNTGTITAAGTGGTGAYSYSLNGVNFDPTGSFAELAAGTYTVTVKDANGCTYSNTVVVGQPSAISATVNTTTSSCGNSNGGLLISASGGSGSGYQYSIDGSTFNATGSFTGLAAATYYVLVKDGAGCENVFPATIVDANGPSIVNSSHTNVACNAGSDGSITINTVTGGTGTLQYSINGTNWQTSTTFNNLSAGVYNVTVKDANGCTGVVTITLTEPSAFVITSTVTNNTCYGDHGGAVTIFASGGSGTLAYSIDNGITYQSSNSFNNLPAGTYNVSVRDIAGCYGTISFTVTQPSVFVAAVGVLNVSCHGANNGSVSIHANGGTGAYQFSLDGNTYQTSGTFNGLSGGNYFAYAKDANGCISVVPFVITEPTPLSLTSSINNVSCSGGNNGAIVTSVSGGTAPYQYSWSNHTTSQNLFNITAGIYTVQVTDAQGCVMSSSYTVVQPASPLIINGVVANASSQTSSDGNILLTVTGGVAPYNYSWSNGSTSQNLTGVPVGNYSVTVTDANGCITNMTFSVSIALGIAPVTVNSKEVNLYPNPSSETATVEVHGYVISVLKVYDVLGQEIFSSEPKQSKVEINSASLPQGIYYVHVIVEGNSIIKKMQVVR